MPQHFFSCRCGHCAIAISAEGSSGRRVGKSTFEKRHKARPPSWRRRAQRFWCGLFRPYSRICKNAGKAFPHILRLLRTLPELRESVKTYETKSSGMQKLDVQKWYKYSSVNKQHSESNVLNPSGLKHVTAMMTGAETAAAVMIKADFLMAELLLWSDESVEEKGSIRGF